MRVVLKCARTNERRQGFRARAHKHKSQHRRYPCKAEQNGDGGEESFARSKFVWHRLANCA